MWLVDYSYYEWIIESKNQIIFPFMNLLVHWRKECLTCFDCKKQTFEDSFCRR